MLADDREEIDSGRVGRAEHFRDDPFRRLPAIRPFFEFDHDLLPQLRRIRGSRDADVVRDARLVGEDVIEHRRLAQGTDKLAAFALEDFYDFAAQTAVALPSASLPATGPLFLQSRQDKVAMKGRAGVFARNVEIRFSGIDGDEKAEPALVHLQAPDAKPETLRQHVKAVPDLHDAPGFFLLGEESGEDGGVFGRDVELASERLVVERLVA